jgi:prophage DNA circulation protein
MRDWTATLYPASYMGVPFWVERDTREGGRRVAIHEFPHNDVPFNEDMGDGPRVYRVTGYIVGDAADADSDALETALSTQGPGTLVLPDLGPIQARAQRPWSRSRSRDELGKVTFELSFVREGAATVTASPAHLAQLGFDAAGALGAAIAARASTVAVAGQPNWINAATVAALDEIPAALESIRTGSTTQTTGSAAVGLANVQATAAIPAAVDGVGGLDPSIITTLTANAVALAAAMTPQTAMGAFALAVAAFPAPTLAQPALTASAGLLQSNAATLAQVARLILITGYVNALLTATYASRPDAVTARDQLNALLDNELAAAVGEESVGLIDAIANLRGTATAYLSALAISLKPIVIVSTARALPSIVLAWRLYGDPTRAAELVSQNDVKHPSFMPLRFAAVAA